MISIIIKDFNNCYNKIYMLNKLITKFKFMSKTLIIAEAGVNHNGNLKLAKKLISVAKKWVRM